MNRLAVGRSARAQQAQKVNNRINWLMALLKTICPLDSEFCSAQDTHTATHTASDGNPRSAQSQLWQTKMSDFIIHVARLLFQ